MKHGEQRTFAIVDNHILRKQGDRNNTVLRF